MTANEVRSKIRTYAIEFEKGYINEEEYINLLLNFENQEIEANTEAELQETISAIEGLIEVMKQQITV